MKQIYIYTFILLSIFGSCSDKKDSGNGKTIVMSIDIEDKSIITDSPALTNVRYVKLETNDECLLEDVSKVVPFENKLYILSSLGEGNIYIFDNNGKFIRKMNKGEGPEDIIYPTDITINTKKKSLLVLDLYRNIKEYDLKGNLLRKISMKEPFLSLESIGDDFVLFDPNTRSKSNHYVRYLTDESAYKDFFQKPIKGKLFSNSNPFTKLNDCKILASCIFSDTIFYITNTEQKLLPYMILDFHNKGANKVERLSEVKGLGDYFKKAKQNKYITGPSNFCILNNNPFFTLNGDVFYFARYNTKKDEIRLHKKLMEGLPNIYGIVGKTDKEVIFSMNMPWLIEYFEENKEIKSDIIKQLQKECNDENDNPVLLFAS